MGIRVVIAGAREAVAPIAADAFDQTDASFDALA
jgi:hypothetical protein